MTISLLQTLVLEALQKCRIEVHVLFVGHLRIVTLDHDLDVSLHNLHKQVLEQPAEQSQRIAEFVSRVVQYLTDLNPQGKIYPRLLLRSDNKSMSHPWTHPLWGSDLEISLIEHSNGRLTFLSPMAVIQRPGGLKQAQLEALTNLATLIPQVEPHELKPGIFRIHHPEVLTSSLVIFLDKLLTVEMSSTCWFAVPSRGTLWFGSVSLEPCLFEIEQDYQRAAHSISRNIYQLPVGAVEQFRHSWQ